MLRALVGNRAASTLPAKGMNRRIRRDKLDLRSRYGDRRINSRGGRVQIGRILHTQPGSPGLELSLCGFGIGLLLVWCRAARQARYTRPRLGDLGLSARLRARITQPGPD